MYQVLWSKLHVLFIPSPFIVDAEDSLAKMAVSERFSVAQVVTINRQAPSSVLVRTSPQNLRHNPASDRSVFSLLVCYASPSIWSRAKCHLFRELTSVPISSWTWTTPMTPPSFCPLKLMPPNISSSSVSLPQHYVWRPSGRRCGYRTWGVALHLRQCPLATKP